MDQTDYTNFFASSVSNRYLDPEKVLDSQLLSLMYSSNVNNIDASHVCLAQKILKSREKLTFREFSYSQLPDEVFSLQRQLVETYLTSRKNFFGSEQVNVIDDVDSLVKDNRDTFIVIKFMDESPHILATLRSLLNQEFDMTRLVIIAVDNNSTDGSDDIVKSEFGRSRSNARLHYLNQPMSGGGNTARYGVDCCIATIYEMCQLDGDWSRLQNSTIAVTDGDTVYTEGVLKLVDSIFKDNKDIDGVMPFLTYKLTSAMRFFSNYSPLKDNFEKLGSCNSLKVDVSLRETSAYNDIPLESRQKLFRTIRDAKTYPIHYDESIPYLGLIDNSGAKAKLYKDGQMLLEEHPVTGDDRQLVYIKNGYIRRSEKWKWHTLVGHDLFLRTLFTQYSFPEEMILPDTSDALKTFRCWSFSIGGQHQLSRLGLKTVTGTDYQSGRVHKAVGCDIALGKAVEYSETEVDRLAKMIRNFYKKQNIFYGDVRSNGLDRASGLYLHMTRIQKDIEAEVSQYSDEFYKEIAFPERVTFPLRWILKNAVISYSTSSNTEKNIIEEHVFSYLIGENNIKTLKSKFLSPEALEHILHASYDDREEMGEKISEDIIKTFYNSIMNFYADVLRTYFSNKGVEKFSYEWLLESIHDAKPALVNSTRLKNPAEAWNGEEYIIDEERGQVIGLDTKK